MLDRLIHALVESKNEAADDLLLQALDLGNEREKTIALDALMRRATVHGLGGVIAGYSGLPDALKLSVLKEIKTFHQAIRESGRSSDPKRRVGAIKLIALGRQGKLSYVLSENMLQPEEQVQRAAIEALVALARWVSIETHRIQQTGVTLPPSAAEEAGGAGIPAGDGVENFAASRELLEQRAEIEQAAARAIDVHRGKFSQELLRAALLLSDWPGSKTLVILHTAKHGGQSPMIRRLQQPPESEHVEAFLLGASHGGLRQSFGSVFSHITEAPVLEALLRKTHWLKDHQLQLCLHQVTRGVWWSDAELAKDIERREPESASAIGEWIAVSGAHDVVQDERMQRLVERCKESFGGRLRLLRIVCSRPRGAGVQLLKSFMQDADERLLRMAAREIVRRRPADFENMLLQMMTAAPDSVRRIISRALGQSGFDNYWERFDHMDKPTRKSAGRAMLKLLPDAAQRLSRLLMSGPVQQRLKAMQMVQELELSDELRGPLVQLSSDPDAKLRSKAVHLLGNVEAGSTDLLMERVLNDGDARVRANAIEVLEERQDPSCVPVLAKLAREASNRERANAIKALHTLRVGTATSQLLNMLRDERPEHRISALWALRQIGWWQMLKEVGNLAKADTNMRVRRYALGVLRSVVDMVEKSKEKKA